MPVKNTIRNDFLLPIMSLKSGNPTLPIRYPKPKIDCIAARVDCLLQYRLFDSIALSLLTNTHLLKSAHAYS